MKLDREEFRRVCRLYLIQIMTRTDLRLNLKRNSVQTDDTAVVVAVAAVVVAVVVAVVAVAVVAVVVAVVAVVVAVVVDDDVVG